MTSAAVQHVVAVRLQDVVAVAAFDDVVVRAAVEPVVARTTFEHVAAGRADHEVGARTADQHVVAAEAEQDVVAAVAEDAIRTGGADEPIGVRGAGDHVGAARARAGRVVAVFVELTVAIVVDAVTRGVGRIDRPARTVAAAVDVVGSTVGVALFERRDRTRGLWLVRRMLGTATREQNANEDSKRPPQ